MSPNDREARIRERAHRIWQSEGCPEDRSDVHWDIAARIIDEEDAAAAAEPPAEAAIDAALADTFPASDPTVMQEPTTSIADDLPAARRRKAS